MSDKTKIEWTDATWNPIFAWRSTPNPRRDRRQLGWHCEHVSEGCRNCYAERMNRRLGNGLEFKPGNRAQIDIAIEKGHAPLRWRKPRMVFVCSMTDLFADFVTDEMIDRVFAVMALCPQHIFQVLTKRPERAKAYGNEPMAGHIWNIADRIACDAHLSEVDPSGPYLYAGARAAPWPLPNVWLGTSVEDQATADARIPDLLATPAALRWVSYEPALGPVDLTRIPLRYEPNHVLNALNGLAIARTESLERAGVMPRPAPFLGWVVMGGESGPGARPMHPDWARQTRDQCAASGAPFFFKQWGRWRELERRDPGGWCIVDRAGGYDIPDHRAPDDEAGEVAMIPLDKKRTGRLLDGRTHDAMPEVLR